MNTLIYILPEESNKVVIEYSDRWTIGFALSNEGNFDHVSFVNSIDTCDGGTHIDYVINPIVNKVVKDLNEKYKDITIKKNYVKDNIFVFVRCNIVNPTFNSQTKTYHTTKSIDFGSKISITDQTIKKIIKLGITNNVESIAKAKDMAGLKKTNGKKTIRLKGIPKLEDAQFAGSINSKECTLILTEGDSAKATAMAGLSIVGQKYYGVFPLKGKLLNVRDASPKKNSRKCRNSKYK